MTTGICFFISVFFAPIFASIPPWATGCTLIIVGAMMAKAAAHINWRYTGDALPAFVTLAVMPFTYSIAYGLIAGIITYAIINSFVWLVDKLSGGRIVPLDIEHKEPWTYKIEGGLLPAWIVRAIKGYVNDPPLAFRWVFKKQHEEFLTVITEKETSGTKTSQLPTHL